MKVVKINEIDGLKRIILSSEQKQILLEDDALSGEMRSVALFLFIYTLLACAAGFILRRFLFIDYETLYILENYADKEERVGLIAFGCLSVLYVILVRLFAVPIGMGLKHSILNKKLPSLSLIALTIIALLLYGVLPFSAAFLPAWPLAIVMASNFCLGWCGIYMFTEKMNFPDKAVKLLVHLFILITLSAGIWLWTIDGIHSAILLVGIFVVFNPFAWFFSMFEALVNLNARLPDMRDSGINLPFVMMNIYGIALAYPTLKSQGESLDIVRDATPEEVNAGAPITLR